MGENSGGNTREKSSISGRKGVKKGSSGSFANSGMNFGMLTWETFSAEYGNCIKGLPYALNIVQYLCPLDLFLVGLPFVSDALSLKP
jgi:hypothetical protein